MAPAPTSLGPGWRHTPPARVNTQAAPTPAASAGPPRQGASVALSGTGNTAIVGGPADDVTGVGAAWAYARFAFGTPGKANSYGVSLSALIGQYGGLGNAAMALGFRSIAAL